jgi:hypothetical protein
MTAMQRSAWFNLAVIALTTTAVLVLMTFAGKAALGGFGFLGLIGFGPFILLRRKTQVVTDERDLVIQRRSWLIAYIVFWLMFVLAAVLLAPAVYGWEGSVPVWVVQTSVFVGFIVVYTVASIAILVQYAGGSASAE